MIPMPTVRIDCWADYVCPFCYLQMSVLDRFIEESRVPFVLEWHAFELRPEPIALIEPDGEYITNIWLNAVYPLAAERNVKVQLPPVAPRSRLAFETAFFSRTVGRFNAVHRALFKPISSMAAISAVRTCCSILPPNVVSIARRWLHRSPRSASRRRSRTTKPGRAASA